MRRFFGLTALFTFAAALWGGCAASGDNNFTSTSGHTGGKGAGGDDITIATGGKGQGGTGPVSWPAHVTGKVVAPEGTIPISGALVYFSPSPPPAIPDGVYCDECVHLDASIPYTTTAPDGTFDLGSYVGSGYLVVQKGAFRRVRPLTVSAGSQAAPKEMTTMPAKMNKANGDDVPKIAVVLGAWDPIEIVLARMGLEAKITSGLFGKPQIMGADATGFAVYGIQAIGDPTPHPDSNLLLTQPSEIEKYHMVFIPCSGGSNIGGEGTACNSNYYGATKSTLDGFVKKGGRVYVSDWSYEYVRQVFPGFVTWQGETSEVGSACQSGGGDQSAPPVDPGLDAWLKAQGKTLDVVKDAWTNITGVHATNDVDAYGKPVSETPKVWVHADSAPATTSFKHGCGRVLYTTYHTQPSNDVSGPLEPQALSLLYLVLEVGVCIDTKVPG